MKERRSSWWKKSERKNCNFFAAKLQEGKKEKKGRKNEKRTWTRQVLGRSGRLLFLIVLLAQNWLCVNAAAEGLQKRTEIMERWQHQEVQVKVSRWAEEISQRCKEPKGEDRAEMKKEAKLLRCTWLNGSAWSTERKYMRRYKGKCDIFFGIEHRLRKEEMEEQLHKAKDGWKFAVSAARITEETTGDEDRKHTSGGVFVAVDSNLGAVVGSRRRG